MIKLLVETLVILFFHLFLRHSKFFKAHLVMHILQRTVMIILLILFCSDLKCISPLNNPLSIQMHQITMKPPPFCPNIFTHHFNPFCNQNMFSQINFSVLPISNAKLFPNLKLHGSKQNSFKLKDLPFLNFTVIKKL